jgi:hypothetical protein
VKFTDLNVTAGVLQAEIVPRPAVAEPGFVVIADKTDVSEKFEGAERVLS